MADDVDARISAMLSLGEDHAPDERFVATVLFRVEAERRLQAVRARVSADLAWKGAACLVVIAAFVLLGRMEPPTGPDGEVSFLSPAMLGMILLGLWAVVDLRPGSFSRA